MERVFSVALGTALVSAAMLASSPAQASTWGCQVVLCLSNPGGATQYSECVPPITRLWRHLAWGGGFPACSGGGVADTDYRKAKGSRPAILTVTFDDGTRRTYVQPRS